MDPGVSICCLQREAPSEPGKTGSGVKPVATPAQPAAFGRCVIIPYRNARTSVKCLYNRMVPTCSNRLAKFSARFNHLCYWCGEVVRLDVGPEHTRVATREHLVPKALKKPGSQSQYVLAHRECNLLRGLADAVAFKRLMAGEAVT